VDHPALRNHLRRHGLHRVSVGVGDGLVGGATMTVRAEPIYSLELPETNRLLAEAESLEAILLAATTLRDDGEDLAGAVVLKGGAYDGATTALVAEGLA
jgi:hypothetical protein